MIKLKQLFSFKKKEVDEAFKDATKRTSGKGLKLLFSEKSSLEHGKLLIIVPSTSGNAYYRNKIRRQIKAIFYEESLYKKKGSWILLVHKPAMNLNFDELKKFLVANIK